MYRPAPLKLAPATYPEPERPTLVNEFAEQTLDFGKDGSKWAHGYIPLNPAAVALKHHKTPGGSGDGEDKKVSDLKSGDKFMGKTVHNVRETPKGHVVTFTDGSVGNAGKPTAAKSKADIHKAAVDRAAKVAQDRHARLNGFKLVGDEPAKAAERAPHQTMADRRKEAAPRAFVNSGDVRLHATKDDGGSKIGTVTKYSSGGYRAQHKDDATPHAGSPFATQKEAVGALVLQHESRTPKTQAERVADIRATPKSVDEHVKLAIAHNEAAKRALDRGDTATAERHVTKSREHNAAAIEGGNAILGKNAIDRATLEGHAAALAIPAKDRTATQQKAADDALAYAKELRAKRLAKKAPAPPKRNPRAATHALATTKSAEAARIAERDRDKPGFGARANITPIKRRSGK